MEKRIVDQFGMEQAPEKIDVRIGYNHLKNLVVVGLGDKAVELDGPSAVTLAGHLLLHASRCLGEPEDSHAEQPH